MATPNLKSITTATPYDYSLALDITGQQNVLGNTASSGKVISYKIKAYNIDGAVPVNVGFIRYQTTVGTPIYNEGGKNSTISTSTDVLGTGSVQLGKSIPVAAGAAIVPVFTGMLLENQSVGFDASQANGISLDIEYTVLS